MFKMFLIKYAEIAIKGKNRYLFEDALVEQIRHTLERVEGHFVVTKESGRVYVSCKSDFDFDEVVAALKTVFGIVGICPVVHIEDRGFDNLAEHDFFWQQSSPGRFRKPAFGSGVQNIRRDLV